MLSRHINRFHKPVYTQHLVAEADKKLAIPEDSKVTMDSYIVNCPKFEQALITWMIATYQPLRCCEDVNFRAMCHSLNRKCPIIGKDKLRSLLNEQYIMTQTKVKMIMKGRSFAFTTDGWTSLANIGYVTCTAHFIDTVTWKLHSMVLGLFEKNGSSTAEDVVRYCTNQLTLFDLSYTEAVAVVTDTEATMIAAGQLFVSKSVEEGGTTKWIGCIDHLLQLVTRKAFSDLPMSEGALKECHNLVNYFNSSSQAMKKLLGKQVAGRAVKPVQDVSTRWWSTYTMCERLLRLKLYLNLMQDEGDLPCNLTETQWFIVSDLQILLRPFMIAQKLLEGEAYVTISLIPYMIYKIRKGLQEAITNPTASHYVRSIATEMLVVFNTHFGQGEAGTVATENLQTGNRRRPKGISMLVLMASFLDPRMKGGVGISLEDRDAIYGSVRTSMIEIAVEVAAPRQVQQNQGEGHVQQHALQPVPPDDLDMFDEIYEHYLDQAVANEVVGGGDREEIHVDAVDAELTLYKQEPSIKLKHDDGRFNCPLTWWREHESKYKLLSILASRLLCIPATSAPSERVFSTAGLTIAKDRARLASDTANELIFLHDALPAIQKYQEAQNG